MSSNIYNIHENIMQLTLLRNLRILNRLTLN
jgi:hypothetical protein